MSRRPTLMLAVDALRCTDPRFPWVGPTEEEADVAAALESIEQTHQGGADEPDDRGRWGRCGGCGDPWPCRVWIYGEDVSIQFLARAADRVYADARAVMDAVDAVDAMDAMDGKTIRTGEAA